MSLPAIEVSGLSKRYVIEHESRHDNLRDTLHHTARKLWRRFRWGTGFEREEFWALRDVSFSIQPGEVVGVIGRNGAGKSTLLKILSRITEPTSGKITLRGRVASLLEVGTGFHPELTGRENIFLNGAILGMSRAEIRQKFDEIVAFAEIEKFLDTPVKRYSSGMYVRLAFAVAAHLDPEILIVDEVLAVGDMQFQKKCLGKMREVSRGQGRTVLFVSHNMTAVGSLCDRSLLFESGRLKMDGPVGESMAAFLSDPSESQPTATWPDDKSAPGDDTVRVRKLQVEGPPGSPTTLTMQSPCSISASYTVKQAGDLHLTFHLINEQGIVAFTTGAPTRPHRPGDYQAICRIPADLFNSGVYSVRLLVVKNSAHVVDARDQAVGFEVVDAGSREGGWYGREPGVVQPRLHWEISPVSPPSR